MKNSILLILFSAFFLACEHKKATNEADACCQKPGQEEPAGFDSEVSVFDVTSTWTTQDNRQVHLSDIPGRVIIAAMIFTNCASACPRITADLKRIEEAIPEAGRQDVSFVLISMDPERDNPERLRTFAGDHQLDLRRWTLLTGTEADVLEISSVLNVRIKKIQDGTFDHSNIIHILNDKGNIVHQQTGLAMDPSESVAVIRKML